MRSEAKDEELKGEAADLEHARLQLSGRFLDSVVTPAPMIDQEFLGRSTVDIW